MEDISEYTELDRSRCLTVHFYGWKPFHTTPLTVSLDSPVTCEQAVLDCARHLSQNLGRFFTRDSEKVIGSLHCPMFGLCMKELFQAKDVFSLLWIADGHSFDSSHAGQELYFRMRVRPPGSKTLAEKIPQGVCADYLFWQCAEDLMSGRVWKLFPSENRIKTIDNVNFNVLHVIMAAALYRLHNVVTCDPSKILHTDLKDITKLSYIKGQVTFWNIGDRVPKEMTPDLQRDYNLRTDLSMRCMSTSYLRKYIKQFFQQNGNRNLQNLRLMFVDKLIREYVPNYGLESFPAQRIDKQGLPAVPVELIIRPFRGWGTPGLYFNKKLVSQLRDILGMEIRDESNLSSEHNCILSLDFRTGPPLVLSMASQQLAESFASQLETFYRLKVDYHGSLQDPLQRGPCLRVLGMLRSYGPMPEEGARRRLRKRRKEERHSADNPSFLLYQDCQAPHLLHVLGTAIGTPTLTQYHIHFHPVDNGSSFAFSVCAPGSSEVIMTTSDKKQLLMHLRSQLMLGQHLTPKDDELCGAMHFVKDDEPDYLYTEILEETEPRRRTRDVRDVPTVYREDQINLTDATLIAKGKFSEVYHFAQTAQERHAVLKKIETTDPAVDEAYRRGAERLMRLREGHHLFVKVYGMVLHPLGIVMESTPQVKGSLLQRISNPNSQLLWFHVSSVLRQLASCFDFLNKSGLVYGSLCCAKILVFWERESEEGQELIIHLGDPSKALFLDTLPVADARNQKRLAWVAPERFADLSRHTFATQVYALGTTLWEMLSAGRQPGDYVPPGASAIQTFGGSNKLPLDFLEVKDVQGEMSQLPDGQGVIKTRDWVATQNFDSGSESGQTSEPEEYMQGGMFDDSELERGEAGPGQAGGDQQEAAARRTDPLHKVKATLAGLITACRHICPDQRPSATTILKKAVTVRKEVLEAAHNDPCWMMHSLLKCGAQMGMVKDPQNIPQLSQDLQAIMQVQQVSPAVRSREELKRLERQVSTSMDQWLIPPARLEDTKHRLGEGCAGMVSMAWLTAECETRAEEEQSEKRKVAVKTLKDHGPEQLSQLLKEALCICTMEHRNVVRLIGLVMKTEMHPTYKLVMEFSDGGSLEVYVKKNACLLGTLDFRNNLKKLATDVAKGMQYVCQEQSRVHGDLAARNVLLFSGSGQGNGPFTAKLADFGQSHTLTQGFYSLQNSKSANDRVPAYLYPPEVLRIWENRDAEVKFSVYTDVWSYGIFLWEIFSKKRPEDELGIVPLPILKRYKEHKFLPKPDDCPLKMYEDVILKCWALNLEDRPKFDKLVDMIQLLTDQDMD
ncbi:hypothetical protein ACOMHN_004913 [Nucella lapillus]